MAHFALYATRTTAHIAQTAMHAPPALHYATQSAPEVTDVTRRWLFLVVGLVVIGLVVPAGFAAPAPAKEETVTLAISGMT